MSKRLDILGARIFGASVCYARKYLQPFRKCPNVWTKSPDLAIMHKHKPHIIRTKACICAFCYFVDFLHTFLDIFSKSCASFHPFPQTPFCIRILRPVFHFFSNFSARFTFFLFHLFPPLSFCPQLLIIYLHLSSAIFFCALFKNLPGCNPCMCIILLDMHFITLQI